jgi:hypothetical protein
MEENKVIINEEFFITLSMKKFKEKKIGVASSYYIVLNLMDDGGNLIYWTYFYLFKN